MSTLNAFCIVSMLCVAWNSVAEQYGVNETLRDGSIHEMKTRWKKQQNYYSIKIQPCEIFNIRLFFYIRCQYGDELLKHKHCG